MKRIYMKNFYGDETMNDTTLEHKEQIEQDSKGEYMRDELEKAMKELKKKKPRTR